MESTIMLRTVISVVTLVAALGSIAVQGAKSAARRPERKPKRIRNVSIAPSSKLKHDQKANKLLVAKRLHHLQKRQDCRREMNRGKEVDLDLIKEQELLDLHDFAKQHRDTRAALLAKFMIGVTLMTRGGEEALESRQCLEEVARNYPGTREAKFAENFFIRLLNLVEEELDPNVPTVEEAEPNVVDLFMQMKQGIQDLLPTAREIDNDANDLSVAFGMRFFGRPGEKIEPMLRISLAHLTVEMGEKKEAIEMLRSIKRDFPNSRWSRDADDDLLMIKWLEEQGRPVDGRLSSCPGIRKYRKVMEQRKRKKD